CPARSTNCRPDRAGIARRIASGSQPPPRGSTMVHVSVGHVELFAARLGQRYVVLMRNHADDLAPLSLRRANAKQDAFAHSRFVWKSLRGKRLVDYQEVSFGRIVVLGKAASGHQGCADGFEIAWQHDLKIGSLEPARVFERFGSAPAHGTEPASERQRKRRRDTAHAGDCAELFAKLTFEGRLLLRGVAQIAEELKREQPAR